MGTLSQWGFEGAQGATLAEAGLGLTGTGTAIHDAAQAVVGGTGGKFTANDGLTKLARLTATVSSNTMAWSAYIRTPAATPSVDFTMATLRNTTAGVQLRVMYTAAGAVGVQGVTGGFHSMATGVALGTQLRWEVLLVAATSTTGTITAKSYTSAAGWTTQLGTTYTNAAFDAGTTPITASDVGVTTAVTPGGIIGVDYVRMEDGRTTEFGPPPAGGTPTANAGASQYVVAGTLITLDGSASTAASGTITGHSWVCTAFPAGATSPAITTPTAATATATLTDGGRYVFQDTVTQTGGATASATVTEYVYEQSNVNVDVFSTTLGLWTNEGGAATALAALNDTSQATFLQSPANPTGQPEISVMNPFGPGNISVFLEGNYSGAALTRTISIYKEDGTTLVDTESYALTSTPFDHEFAIDATSIAAIPALSDRRALVVKVSDTV